MGNLEEAATLFEKASGLNPEVWASTSIPAATYGLLGREKEARAALDNYKKGWSVEPQLPQIMFYFPFKDRSVADRFAEGLIKAGLPPGKVSGGYFPAFKENQLTGEEIKRLTYGSKLTGIGFNNQQWWMDKKKNGEFTWRGAGPIPSDTGKSRIEGDMECLQFQKIYWGLEYCLTVFRNPRGT